ncbi:MAG: hypothetical protein Ta2A_10710 [Treponemataceae bacterium]|nr:MAG: hypothetical protein Ta2A_10710 [Treponemataceae bacterium]
MSILQLARSAVKWEGDGSVFCQFKVSNKNALQNNE